MVSLGYPLYPEQVDRCCVSSLSEPLAQPLLTVDSVVVARRDGLSSASVLPLALGSRAVGKAHKAHLEIRHAEQGMSTGPPAEPTMSARIYPGLGLLIYPNTKLERVNDTILKTGLGAGGIAVVKHLSLQSVKSGVDPQHHVKN